MKNILSIALVGFLISNVSGCVEPMSEDSATIAAAQAGYAAFQAGDMTAWSETQADDAVWTIPQGLPYGGTYIGPESVIDNVFAPISALWPDFSVEDLEYHVSGNTVFIKTRITAGGLVSDSLHVAVMENGKYASFQVFDDTAFMMKSAQTSNTAQTAASTVPESQ